MQADEDGLTAEIDKKTAPPPFECIPSTTPDRSSSHRVVADIMITMRDGVQLATDVYLPASSPTALDTRPSEEHMQMKQRVASWQDLHHFREHCVGSCRSSEWCSMRRAANECNPPMIGGPLALPQ